MKNKILGILYTTALINNISAQVVNDSVAIAPGYMNQSYYNLQSGEVSNISNNDWDLAFDVSAFGAAIRLNRRIDNIYVAPIDTTDWLSLDTTGYITWDEYSDGYDAWANGALNAPADPEVAEDLGWGLYNTITHATIGNRIFLVKQSGGEFKKLWIKKLASGTYTFVHANIDNTEEETVTILKADYSDKNFIYYELSTATIVDREPASTEWDLVFTNYVDEVAPGYYYGVTGVLINYETNVYRSSTLPVEDATYHGGDFSSVISTIGYDWKSFNMETFTFDIADSLCYFIQTQAGDVWKLVFTGFNGSSDGKMYFSKEKIETASITSFEESSILCYPNPSKEIIHVSALGQNLNQIELYDSNGLLLFSTNNVDSTSSQIDLTNYSNGIYFLRVTMLDGNSTNQRVIIAK
jgi:hypothetical protein